MKKQKIKCKYCNAIHEISDELIGAKIQCADCDNKFFVDDEYMDSKTITFDKKNIFAQEDKKRKVSTASLENLLKEKNISNNDNDPEVDFAIVGSLGEGGMGIVHKAIQNPLRRFVALKMLSAETIANDEDAIKEFIQEAAITAYLDHPNIVSLYDIAKTPDNTVFYTMKEVKGAEWSELIKKNTTPENIDILLKVCDAVAFAHDKGIIHRDLKPENIMLGNYGEVFLMDWGLAVSYQKNLNIPGVETLSKNNIAISGSPAFMPPEMANSDIKKIGTASDVYLLGGLLLYILINKAPHPAEEVNEALIQAQNNTLVEITETGIMIDIAKKALSTSIKDRYYSVKSFQGAIRKGLGHLESINLAQSATKDFEKAKKDLKYNNFAQALFAYKEAFKLWNKNKVAKQGIIDVSIEYAKCAISRSDFDLALSLLDDKNHKMSPLISQAKDGIKQRNFRKKSMKIATVSTIVLLIITFLVMTISYFEVKDKQKKAELARINAEQAAQVAKSEKTKAEKAAQVAKFEKEKADKAFQDMQVAEKIAKDAATKARKEQIKAEIEQIRAENALKEAELAQIATRKAESSRIDAEKRVEAMQKSSENTRDLEKRRKMELINSICLNITKKDYQNAFDILNITQNEKKDWDKLLNLLTELKDFKSNLEENIEKHTNDSIVLEYKGKRNLAKIKKINNDKIYFDIKIGQAVITKAINIEKVQVDVIKKIVPSISEVALDILFERKRYLSNHLKLNKELKRQSFYTIKGEE